MISRHTNYRNDEPLSFKKQEKTTIK
jgi:hypothetical protein